MILLNLRPNWCYFARKRRRIRSIQKSDFLCFQVLLSFVPTIFHFLQNSIFSHIRRAQLFSCGAAGLPVAYDNVSTS